MWKTGYFVILFAMYFVAPCESAPKLEGTYRDFETKMQNQKKGSQIDYEAVHKKGMAAYHDQNWAAVLECFTQIHNNFRKDPKGDEALYFMGVASMHLGKIEAGEDYLSRYLEKSQQPKYFEQAQKDRFEIAKMFRKGEKIHLFGWPFMPKWMSGKTQALEILDEIALTMPYTDLAAQSFYEMGKLLVSMKDYKGAADAFAMLAKRFPDHELAAKSYVKISELYLEQAQKEYQNPDLLNLADINFTRFRNAYPGHEALEKAKKNIQEMREVYSQGLLDTGRFYERKKLPKASAIYYLQAIGKFPDTRAASLSKSRLKALELNTEEITTMIAESGIDLEQTR